MQSALNKTWPVLKTYDQCHLRRISLPVGGIGTGTVTLGGWGELRDWEVMNRPAKGFTPTAFFLLHARPAGGEAVTRCLEGPVDTSQYEGGSGAVASNHGLPRFRNCSFATAYPLAQVLLSDPEVPVDVRLEAFNPMVPGDADASGMPVAVLRYVLTNRTSKRVFASVCGTVANFIGVDKAGDPAVKNVQRNEYRSGGGVRGVYLHSLKGDPKAEKYGSVALTTTSRGEVSHREAWLSRGWAGSILEFWDDFSADGRLSRPRDLKGNEQWHGSLAAEVTLGPRKSAEVTFIISWHFPNRYTWTPKENGKCSPGDMIGNYYTRQYKDAWDVARRVAPRLPGLERETVKFVRAFCDSDLPAVAKEAALFNVAHLRTQTAFRTPDGRMFGWEGCADNQGCCHGTCTHVWNYEQAVAFLYGDLAMKLREVEFRFATDKKGMMSFRVGLPLSRAQCMGKAAADGQMGCIMKMYRDWQLSGDDKALRRLWPNVRRAVEFCWLKSGWDADKDGVMEGCQHNTMDVEYYGPNPQMGIWYLGALRAAEEMARHLGDTEFAGTCRGLFDRGSTWIDRHLFNGEYYEHQIRMPKRTTEILPGVLLGADQRGRAEPDYQLGKGCLVDQLVGQFVAHVCGLGHLVKPANVRRTLKSILRYNLRRSMRGHFNNMRSFALGEEAALLMAAYPKDRPRYPFPYFTEVMTGFEYAAAVNMLQEGMTDEGLMCIKNIRDRYDGRKRSPFNEAECGHHYARSMASWGAVPALSGFRYSGVKRAMEFAARNGRHFWSNGYAWGTCVVKGRSVTIEVLHGSLPLRSFSLGSRGGAALPAGTVLRAGRTRTLVVG